MSRVPAESIYTAAYHFILWKHNMWFFFLLFFLRGAGRDLLFEAHLGCFQIISVMSRVVSTVYAF